MLIENKKIINKDIAAEIISAVTTSTLGNKIKLNKNPDPETLAKDLNEAYIQYLGWEDFQSHATPKQFNDAIKDAQKQTEKLILIYDDLKDKVIKLSSKNPSQTVFSTEDLLDSTIVNLETISGYLDLIKPDDLTNPLPAKGKSSAKTYLAGLLLPEFYKKHFQREIAISRTPEGNPSGPLLRFLRACLQQMSVKLTDEAIVSAVRKHSEMK